VTIQYRMAGPDDLAQLTEMRWEFRSEYRPVPEEVSREKFFETCLAFLQEAFASGRWYCWIAEVDDQILAHVFLQRIAKIPIPTHFKSEFGWVTNVYTRPEWRNQNIGAELMQLVEEWAQEEDLQMLVLWPSKRAVPFYERAGFHADTAEMEFRIRDD
jgi:GNAT superfamily N-acetyltransferase